MIFPFTPGHFLIGDSLLALPEPDVQDVKFNRLNRYQLLKQLVQSFWNRWSNEYLSQLNKRSKWMYSRNDNLKVGDLVVLREENVPPLKWARVQELFPGTDGVVRVVSVKTSKGSFKRANSKLCVLPDV